MKIVILDGHTITQDDLTWDSLRRFGDLIMYDQTPYDEEETVKRIDDAQLVLVSKVPITASVIKRCPNLQYIGVTATGYNVVDVKAANERGIIVTNVPGYGTETVAEFVFALLLHMTRQVGLCAQSVERGEWCKSQDFCYLPTSQISLFGKVMGIVGFGQIGRKTAEIAQAFGMKVLVFTRHPNPKLETKTLSFVSLDELLSQSDIVSLHCPLTEDNYHMINEETLQKMKPSAYLINTSRGPLVNEDALRTALTKGWIKAAALDVIEQEPMDPKCPLLGIPNCVIVPHIAWATKECRELLIQMIQENIEAFFNKNPIHVVSVK